MSRPGVLLDRDGTVSREKGYINHADRFELYPGSAQAIRRLNDLGVPAVLITNQAGVARGYFPLEVVEKVHERLKDLLRQEADAQLDGIYYCPHHKEGKLAPYNVPCRCRKPDTELAERAAADLDLDLASSFMVGDKLSDMEFARRISARAILVKTGYGRGLLEYYPDQFSEEPDYIAEDLPDAVDWILSQMELG